MSTHMTSESFSGGDVPDAWKKHFKYLNGSEHDITVQSIDCSSSTLPARATADLWFKEYLDMNLSWEVLASRSEELASLIDQGRELRKPVHSASAGRVLHAVDVREDPEIAQEAERDAARFRAQEAISLLKSAVSGLPSPPAVAVTVPRPSQKPVVPPIRPFAPPLKGTVANSVPAPRPTRIPVTPPVVSPRPLWCRRRSRTPRRAPRSPPFPPPQYRYLEANAT